MKSIRIYYYNTIIFILLPIRIGSLVVYNLICHLNLHVSVMISPHFKKKMKPVNVISKTFMLFFSYELLSEATLR